MSRHPAHPDPRPIPTGVARGEVRLPGSKSIAQRSLILAALAVGESRLVGAPRNADVDTLVAALRALGIGIEREGEAGEVLVVRGCAASLPGGDREVDLGENGTALRCLIALAALRRDPTRIAGASHRPVAPLLDALRALDARIEGERPPLAVRGPIRGGEVAVESALSSQFATALLLIAPALPLGLTITAPGLVSRPYLELTAALVREFRATVTVESASPRGAARGAGPGAERWRVPSAILRGHTLAIEPDASAAAFPLAVAAVTGGDVSVLGLGRGSLQGDARFADLLARMGCAVEVGEERIRVRGGALRAIDADLVDTPDLAPPLAAVAAFARGRSVLRGIAHLRHKESDRLQVLARGLETLGFPARAGADSLEIEGGGPGRGGVADPAGDHRMAMAFAVIGTRVPGVRVRDPACVAKSDPRFFERLEALVSPRESE